LSIGIAFKNLIISVEGLRIKYKIDINIDNIGLLRDYFILNDIHIDEVYRENHYENIRCNHNSLLALAT